VTRKPPATFLALLGRLGIKLHLVRDPAKVPGVIAALRRDAGREPISFDLETAVDRQDRAFVVDPKKPGLDPLLARPVVLSLHAGGDTVFVADLAATGLDPWRDLLESDRLVAFHAVFDVRVLFAAGVPVDRADCAFIAAGLAKRDVPKSLDVEAEAMLKVALPQAKKAMQRTDWNDALRSRDGEPDNAACHERAAYAGADAVLAFRLWQHCEYACHCDAYAFARDAILPTAKIELRGLPFDAAVHDAICTGWAARLEPRREAFVDRWGFKPSQKMKLAALVEETAPPAMLRKWPRTPSGGLSLARADLTDDKHADRMAVPLVADIEEASRLGSLFATFGPALRKRVHPLDGRLHGGFLLCGARTGRYTSSPNLQNLPKGGGFRRIVRARPGRRIVVADFAAVELRAAAIESGEKSLFAVFANVPALPDGSRNPDGCPHENIARRLKLRGGTQDDEVGRIRKAKAVNFAPLYGCGADTFASKADVTVEEAEAILDGLRRARPSLARWQDRTRANADRRKVAETPGGRGVDLYVYDKATKQRFVSKTRALNVPVQGGCAEAMLRAVIRVDAALEAAGLDAFLVATVHDELIVDAAEADAEAAGAILVEEMREAFRDAYAGRPGVDECAEHLIDAAKVLETWGGAPLDPDNLPADLWRGIDLADAIDEGDCANAPPWEISPFTPPAKVTRPLPPSLTELDDPVDDLFPPAAPERGRLQAKARSLTVRRLASGAFERVSAAYAVAGVETIAQADEGALQRLIATLKAKLPPKPKGPAHASLGPSSAYRWMECPGSIAASQAAHHYAGIAAHRGTRAHTMLEMCLRAGLDPEEVGSLAEAWPQEADLVRDLLPWARALPGKLLVERRVVIDADLDLWGTADVIAVAEVELVIADLKAGIEPVAVEDNAQLGAYAIGARAAFGRRPRYRLAILQPKVDPVPAVVTVDDAWLDDLEARLRSAGALAKAALDDDRAPVSLAAGPWCKWCAARKACASYREMHA
jgi:DNA polymerase I-like protein with 3'-5' exonuclease and polymerase domains